MDDAACEAYRRWTLTAKAFEDPQHAVACSGYFRVGSCSICHLLHEKIARQAFALPAFTVLNDGGVEIVHVKSQPSRADLEFRALDRDTVPHL